MCIFHLSGKRKFYALVGVFMCLYPVVCPAQLRVGPKAGLQVSRSVFADKEYRQEYTSGLQPGVNVGVVLNYKVNNLYSLHTELLYSQKGKVSRNKVYIGDDVRNRAVYHFIDLPVLLRLSKKKNYRRYRVEYYANIGPSLNYWLGGNGTVRSDELEEFTDNDTYHYRIRFKDEPKEGSVHIPAANRFQMSLDFGGGVLFDLGNGQLIMVDLRNSVGIGKTFMGNSKEVTYGLSNYKDNFEAVNHVYALSVAYLLEIDMQALFLKGRFRR